MNLGWAIIFALETRTQMVSPFFSAKATLASASIVTRRPLHNHRFRMSFLLHVPDAVPFIGWRFRQEMLAPFDVHLRGPVGRPDREGALEGLDRLLEVLTSIQE